jgi:serine acetyltransferase
VVPGARVFINGQPVGVTPVVLKDVPAGSRAVRVEATGYGTWSASLQVTANRQTRVMAKLDRVIPAVSK